MHTYIDTKLWKNPQKVLHDTMLDAKTAKKQCKMPQWASCHSTKCHKHYMPKCHIQLQCNKPQTLHVSVHSAWHASSAQSQHTAIHPPKPQSTLWHQLCVISYLENSTAKQISVNGTIKYKPTRLLETWRSLETFGKTSWSHPSGVKR